MKWFVLVAERTKHSCRSRRATDVQRQIGTRKKLVNGGTVKVCKVKKLVNGGTVKVCKGTLQAWLRTL